MGKEEIWAVLCVCNFLKSRSKNAKAFLNKLLEFHKKSQDGELIEELSILGFYHFTVVSLYKNDK